jgi:hypothetical protein
MGKDNDASSSSAPASKTSRARARKGGAGWGGPAKGAGMPTPRHDLGGNPGPGRGHYSKAGEGRLERQARHAEEMRQIYYEFAHDDSKEDAIRLTAATHMLNRSEGLPVQKVVTASTDPISLMGDDELEAEREKLQKRKATLDRMKKRGQKSGA